MWKQHFKARAFGVGDSLIAAIIIAVVVYGVSAVTAWYSAHTFRLAGVPSHWALLIGVGVFLVLALSLNLISLAITRFSRKETVKSEDTKPAVIECFDPQVHAVADHDRNSISSAVIVKSHEVEIRLSDDGLHEILINLTIFNGSAFEISTTNLGENDYLVINKQPLNKRGLEMSYGPVKGLLHSVTDQITIRQQLTEGEAKRISNWLREGSAALYLNHINVNVTGGEKHQDIVPKRLNLPAVSLKTEEVLKQWGETEIASLKAQLEEEKAKNTKPNITGEIKEVFFESRFSPISKVIDDFFYADFYFWVRVYVANHGATTTIKEFKFTLNSSGRQQDGEKETLEGWHIQRQTGKEELIDIEVSNDAPLEHSRNGWLRFTVNGVEESSIRHTENDPMPEMEIEIDAIDKDGTPHRLIGLPQSQWRENALWTIPRIEHIRELNS